MVIQPMSLKLLLAALFVAANAFFVAAEFALVKVRESQLAMRARKGEPNATRALGILQKLDSYLSACQLGVTLASLALGWVGEPALAEVLAPVLHRLGVQSEAVVHGIALSTAFFVITILHIVLGEQAPKMMAIQRAEPVALAVSRPLKLFHSLTFPILFVVNGLSNATLRALGISSKHEENALSSEEIRFVVAGGRIDSQKRELMERVLQGTDRPVRAIMVPRVDVAFLSQLDSAKQLLAAARTCGFSRIPLIEGRDPDKVQGYVYVKDLFLAEELPAGGISAVRRDILFVPESRKVGDVLKDFQKTRIPIAIVVDEYGGTSGLVTVEDIVEEIVGDLQDELDAEPPKVQQRKDNTYIVDGSIAIAELSSLGVELEPVEGHDTLGGHIVARMGRLARPGDVVRIGHFDATVEDVRHRRVTRVRLERRPDSILPTADMEADGGHLDGQASSEGVPPSSTKADKNRQRE